MHPLNSFSESSQGAEMDISRDPTSISNHSTSTLINVASSSSCSDDSCNQIQDRHDTIKNRNPKKRKRCPHDTSSKICAVCGDVAKSMHFGGMACDSCKAFFRRSVQSNSYHQFKCNAQKCCPILKDNRRICQYCRFQKCQGVGMDVAWVMSETDRMALWKSKLAKHRKSSKKGTLPKTEVGEKQNQTTTTAQTITTSSNLPLASGISFKTLSKDEIDVIRHLTTLQETVFSSMPYPDECIGDTPISLANLFFCICQKLRIFFFRLEEFHEVLNENQVHILRNGIAMSIYLHGAYNYDVVNEVWPVDGINESLKIPFTSKHNLKVFTSFPEIYDALINFYNKYGSDIKDEAVLVLLVMVALFQDSDISPVSKHFVTKMNTKYTTLLRNCLLNKLGEFEGSITFRKFRSCLNDLKRIISFHSKVDIRPTVKPSEIIPHNGSFINQMIALSEIMKGNVKENLHEHASVFTPEERLDLLMSKQAPGNSLSHIPNRKLDPRPEIQYHYFTNSIFGNEVTTNRLLSLSLPNVFGGRRPVLNEEIRQRKLKDNNNGSFSRTNRGLPGILHRQTNGKSAETKQQQQQQQEQQEQVARTPSSELVNQSWDSLVKLDKSLDGGNNNNTAVYHLNQNFDNEILTLPSHLIARISENKKIKVQKLKECLEYLSESEDVEMMHLLQQKLSPKLREYLTSDIQNMSFRSDHKMAQIS